MQINIYIFTKSQQLEKSDSPCRIIFFDGDEFHEW